jgi:hypothetical protein
VGVPRARGAGTPPATSRLGHGDAHQRLRQLGEPIMVFGEHEMECRDRLCTLMVHLEAEGKVDLLLRAQEDD